ncbi:hypothetical protein EYF80_000845 [Liparis tanakae]|uniref:Uncharacterized protein n=1 Tax=Liparis tanakae TaxID=230148 RepID=A0A4Z2JGA4_9TELE|nr:hypothetical protein EYF80_000845 [Liparis tanakae]
MTSLSKQHAVHLMSHKQASLLDLQNFFWEVLQTLGLKNDQVGEWTERKTNKRQVFVRDKAAEGCQSAT